jgi:hypothetical protein
MAVDKMKINWQETEKLPGLEREMGLSMDFFNKKSLS